MGGAGVLYRFRTTLGVFSDGPEKIAKSGDLTPGSALSGLRCIGPRLLATGSGRDAGR
jgi:hypothetical protein